MPSKTFVDFFGSQATQVNEDSLTFSPYDIFAAAASLNFAYDTGYAANPNQVVAMLLFYWALTNYADSASGDRLSLDKNVPIVSTSELPRKSLVTRDGESQVRYDIGFSIYYQYDDVFDPEYLVTPDDDNVPNFGDTPPEGQ